MVATQQLKKKPNQLAINEIAFHLEYFLFYLFVCLLDIVSNLKSNVRRPLRDATVFDIDHLCILNFENFSSMTMEIVLNFIFIYYNTLITVCELLCSISYYNKDCKQFAQDNSCK